MLQVNRPPPPHYYADKLSSVFETVRQQYNDILTPRERVYVQHVLQLNPEALRLYARLVTRKGPVFRLDSLNYRELRDPAAAIEALAARRLIETCGVTPADRVLKLLKMSELAELFPNQQRANKAQLIDRLAGQYPDTLLRSRVAAAHEWLCVRSPELIELVTLLFFGDSRQDLSTFVLEDLGMVRFEPYALEPGVRNFPSRADLDAYLRLLTLRRSLDTTLENWTTERAEMLLRALWERVDNRALERTRSRLLNTLARQAEREGDFDLAMTAYHRSSREPARERRARLLSKLGDVEASRHVIADMARANGRERAFAETFDPGKRAVTRRRYCERHLTLRQAPSVSVEQAALAAVTANIGWGVHLENVLPRTILGLAFWDIVFSPVAGAFANPYQAGPKDLYWADFRAMRAAAISARLQSLGRTEALRRRVLDTWHAKRGIHNTLVSWRLSPRFIDAAVSIIGSEGWLPMLDHMLDDLEVARTGFPDLTILLGCRRYQLVEVKGPGDQMRPEQRLWFDFFAKHQMPAVVLRVSW